jgi:peptidoglycan/LPS O-acetylase OafA/YrhL
MQRNATRKNHNPNIKALTGIRIFPALFIVLVHTLKDVNLHLPSQVTYILSNIPMRLGFFFVLSGFVIAYSFHDTRFETYREKWGFCCEGSRKFILFTCLF